LDLVCDLVNAGEVIDTSKFCSCRNCTAGECYCGNGIIEPGEQCEATSSNDSCCVNCKFTHNSCDDNDKCTTNDHCDGNHSCIGIPKCPSSTDCRTISCDPLVGECDVTNFVDGLPCGEDIPGKTGVKDLCNRRCIAGICHSEMISCTDSNTADCKSPVCVPETGLCNGTTHSKALSICSDGDLCTFSDVCDDNGRCGGKPIICEKKDDNPCTISTCNSKTGSCETKNLEGDVPCDSDDDKCTLDYCRNGVCIAGYRKQCDASTTCIIHSCNRESGDCEPSYTNNTCNDEDICTENDHCFFGKCKGNTTERTLALLECGSPFMVSSRNDATIPIAVITTLAGSALFAALIGLAIWFKKSRQSKLLDPATWSPENFTTVAANPLYKESAVAVDNLLYEVSS